MVPSYPKLKKLVGPHLSLAANHVANRLPHWLATLFRHTLCHAHGGDTPRLRHDDLDAYTLRFCLFEDELRDLSRLATSRAAADEDNLSVSKFRWVSVVSIFVIVIVIGRVSCETRLREKLREMQSQGIIFDDTKFTNLRVRFVRIR